MVLPPSAPRLAATLVATLALLLILLTSAAPARERTFSPRRVDHGGAVFAIRGIRPAQVQDARVRARRTVHRLRLSRVRAGVRRGRVTVPSATGRSRLVVTVDDSRPTRPGGLRAAGAEGGAVTLRWRRSVDNEAVVAYAVYRGATRVAEVPGTTFTDPGLAGARRYRYHVRARDGARNLSGASASVTASPGPASYAGAAGEGASWRCGWGGFGASALPGDCWRPYAPDSFFNSPLPAAPRLAGASRAIVARMFSSYHVPSLRPNPEPGEDWYHPFFFSRPSDPWYRISCTKHDYDCPVEGMQIRIPERARPAQSSDGHMTVIDQASGWEYDFWGAEAARLSRGGGTIRVGWGGRTRIDGAGGGDAASASPANMAATGLVGGIIRYPELAAGRIDHALFLVTRCTNGRMVFPARDYGGVCSSPRDAPAAGQWLRLDMTPAQIDALRVSGWQKTILRALARYGGFVGDAGSDESIGFQLESPQTFTSIGAANPWLAWARAQRAAGDANVSTYDRGDGVTRYALDVAGGLDAGFWTSRLQVVDPCVINRTC